MNNGDCDAQPGRVIIGATYDNLRLIICAYPTFLRHLRRLRNLMRTEHEKMYDAEFLTQSEKSVRRVEEAGVIRTPYQTRKLANERLRVAICELTDANIESVQEWLNKVAGEDPAKAIDFLLRMLEFSVPKLSRVEAVAMTGGVTGDLGDLTVRDLQEMVLRARRAGSIEGEATEVPPEAEGLI